MSGRFLRVRTASSRINSSRSSRSELFFSKNTPRRTTSLSLETNWGVAAAAGGGTRLRGGAGVWAAIEVGAAAGVATGGNSSTGVDNPDCRAITGGGGAGGPSTASEYAIRWLSVSPTEMVALLARDIAQPVSVAVAAAIRHHPVVMRTVANFPSLRTQPLGN